MEDPPDPQRSGVDLSQQRNRLLPEYGGAPQERGSLQGRTSLLPIRSTRSISTIAGRYNELSTVSEPPAYIVAAACFKDVSSFFVLACPLSIWYDVKDDLAFPAALKNAQLSVQGNIRVHWHMRTNHLILHKRERFIIETIYSSCPCPCCSFKLHTRKPTRQILH